MGILLDGFDSFIIGVANPLIDLDFGISDAEKGLVSAAAIVGAIFGAGLLGPLGDKIGRRRIFQFGLALFVVFSVLSAAAPNVWWLIAFRLVLGVAIGLDYPIAASYLAEALPARGRGGWLTAAFSLQAGGIMLGALIGVVVLELAPDVDSWRIMLGVGAVPRSSSCFSAAERPESPRWLAQNGRADEAREVAETLTGHPVQVTEKDKRRGAPIPEGLTALVQPQLFRRALRRHPISTSVPWFLMDIATYGVGIFTPTLLAAIRINGANTTFISDDIASTKGTAALDVFLVIGFVLAIWLVDRTGRIPLQVAGFAMMTVALALLAVVEGLPGGGDSHLALVFRRVRAFQHVHERRPERDHLHAGRLPSRGARRGPGLLRQRARSSAPPSASSCSRSSWTTPGRARCWRSLPARAWRRWP